MKHFFIESTTWPGVDGVPTRTEIVQHPPISKTELRKIGNPDVLKPSHLVALGFTPKKYRLIRVFEIDDNGVYGSLVSRWRARKSLRPWNKRMFFRHAREPIAHFRVG